MPLHRYAIVPLRRYAIEPSVKTTQKVQRLNARREELVPPYAIIKISEKRLKLLLLTF
jgi:hypothetical protein